MKKKHVLLMCALLTFSLTACGGEEKATVTNTTNAKQEVEVQELENEVDSQEEADGSTQEETVTSSEDESDENSETVDKEESLLDQEALSEMLTGFIDWSGFQYLETPIEVDTLTGKQAIPMAAHVVAFFNNDLEQTTEGQMVIPKELLDDTMIQYFGKTFDVSEVGDLEEETSRITLDENGNVLLQIGDWGLLAPAYEIKDIFLAEDGSGDVLAQVEYGWIDYELGKETQAGYCVTYRLEKTENAKYGFVITDMQAVQLLGNE